MNRKTMAAATLVGAVLALTGCSGGGKQQPVSVTPTPAAQTTRAAESPAPKAPVVLTREQAAKRYLQIVGPFNTVLDGFNKVASPIDDNIGWSSERDLMASIRKAATKVSAANRKMIAELKTTPWPAEAKQAISDLTDLAEAQQLAMNKLAKAQTIDDYYAAQELWPPDDGSPELVRARLGLPARASS